MCGSPSGRDLGWHRRPAIPAGSTGPSKVPGINPTDPTDHTDNDAPPALRLTDVTVRIDDRLILDKVSWTVGPGERWVVLGRNGSGKTTVLRVASLYLHPSSGSVEVVGETLGRADVRRVRTRIGIASASFADKLRPGIRAEDVVVTARYAALEPWWHTYDDTDYERARVLLDGLGVGHVVGQAFGTLSSGERQRVQLARTLMTDPGLLLLDEPTAGLDLGGREELVSALTDLAADASSPPMVLVTHHVEEIPVGFTHALLLKGGTVFACGHLEEVIDQDRLSECFDLRLVLTRADGRWFARAST
jgi:iron complex transport system ATP-binding protein